MAERLLASVFFLPSVINFSASLCASFALGHDVEIDSCSMRDVTRLRRSALRWAESLLKWRYSVSPFTYSSGVLGRLCREQIAERLLPCRVVRGIISGSSVGV
jgi:hypothetical protein